MVSQCWIIFGVLSISLVDKMAFGEKFCFGCASRHEVCLPDIYCSDIYSYEEKEHLSSRKLSMVYLSIECTSCSN